MARSAPAAGIVCARRPAHPETPGRRRRTKAALLLPARPRRRRPRPAGRQNSASAGSAPPPRAQAGASPRLPAPRPGLHSAARPPAPSFPLPALPCPAEACAGSQHGRRSPERGRRQRLQPRSPPARTAPSPSGPPSRTLSPRRRQASLPPTCARPGLPGCLGLPAGSSAASAGARPSGSGDAEEGEELLRGLPGRPSPLGLARIKNERRPSGAAAARGGRLQKPTAGEAAERRRCFKSSRPPPSRCRRRVQPPPPPSLLPPSSDGNPGRDVSPGTEREGEEGGASERARLGGAQPPGSEGWEDKGRGGVTKEAAFGRGGGLAGRGTPRTGLQMAGEECSPSSPGFRLDSAHKPMRWFQINILHCVPLTSFLPSGLILPFRRSLEAVLWGEGMVWGCPRAECFFAVRGRAL